MTKCTCLCWVSAPQPCLSSDALLPFCELLCALTPGTGPSKPLPGSCYVGTPFPTAHRQVSLSESPAPGASCELQLTGVKASSSLGRGPPARSRPPRQPCGPGLVVCPPHPRIRVGEGAADVVVSRQGRTGKRPCSEGRWSATACSACFSPSY